MKINRRVMIGILLIGLLFSTGILLRGFLLENVVKPVALLLWTGNRLIASIDQVVYWAGLIMALLLVSLLRYYRQTAEAEEERSESKNSTFDSITHWRMLILMTADETTQLNFLKQSLEKLLKDIYASKEPSQAPWQIYQEIEQDEVRLPSAIKQFLALGPATTTQLTLAQRLQHTLRAPARWLHLLKRQNVGEYHQSIAEVISFMEKELENKDDD